jgi:hypothetical protein
VRKRRRVSMETKMLDSGTLSFKSKRQRIMRVVKTVMTKLEEQSALLMP